ncbi:ABC transporter permease [Vibrio ulleungensis]|uniref:ABC transporter permease n=1 Tax=Vibrio ulleungensis TaxID=2807619 RepID=A0ABS2HCY0_9VIBR|nr:ABC transporter permease [Vibrio ulleungensis]MBM7035458.1 ABC transporter permease [Vibrio ulleungensis]
MLIKLAWRNLWRQKRRTILTASAIALALFLSLLMRSFQEGQYTSTIENSAKMSTGMIQIQHPDYKDSLSIDDLLPSTSSFIQSAQSIDHIEHLLPRLESFSLAAAGERSKGVMMSGIHPDIDPEYTGLKDRLVKGEFIELSDRSVLIGAGVARYFDLDVGDEIVFYGQGYRGQTAAGLYPIKGIVEFALPEINNTMVYLPLPLAQELLSTGEQVSAWVIALDSLKRIDDVSTQLKAEYEPEQTVWDWTELAPEIEQSIVLDRVSGQFMMYLLYGIVGFGLFATLVMMTLERQREFAVMLATGMLRSKLVTLICVESAMIGLLGSAIGIALASPIIVYFFFNPIRLGGETAQMMLDMGYEPIMPVALDAGLYINQVLIVLGLLAICMVYPIARLLKLKVVQGLKGGAHAH